MFQFHLRFITLLFKRNSNRKHRQQLNCNYIIAYKIFLSNTKGVLTPVPNILRYIV